MNRTKAFGIASIATLFCAGAPAARADGNSDPMRVRDMCIKDGHGGSPDQLRACCDDLILVDPAAKQKRYVEACVSGVPPKAAVTNAARPAASGAKPPAEVKAGALDFRGAMGKKDAVSFAFARSPEAPALGAFGQVTVSATGPGGSHIKALERHCNGPASGKEKLTIQIVLYDRVDWLNASYKYELDKPRLKTCSGSSAAGTLSAVILYDKIDVFHETDDGKSERLPVGE